MKVIFRIGRKLPKPVRAIFSKVYYRCFFRLDREMVKNLSEYSNITEKEAKWLLTSTQRLDAILWRIQNPKTEKEIEQFYKISPFYIFGLAYWHMKDYQIEFRNEIIKFANGKILDFGGGIGDISIELQKKGFDCDYADISGRIFDFARWMFKKRNCPVNMIDLACQKISKKYDTIYCIDVIEHVLNPKETLKELAGHLNNNGRLIITNLDVPEEEEHPMHFAMDFDAEKYLNSLGLFKREKPWLWIKQNDVKNFVHCL